MKCAHRVGVAFQVRCRRTLKRMHLTQVAVVEQRVHTDSPVAVVDERHARTRMLLEAPIASTLIMLAAPTLLVNIAQSAVGVIETYLPSVI